MKILFYNHTNQVSGAERVLLLILARLNRNRFEPVLLCPTGKLQNEAKAVGVRCETVKQLHARFTGRADHLIRYLASFVSVVRQVRARVKEAEPDLIHANSIRAGLVISAATIGLRIPIIWHVHDFLPAHPLSTFIRLFVLLRPPAQIIVVAHAARERFRGDLLRWFFDRAPIAVIHNAVDSQKLRRPVSKGLGLRKELRVRSADKLIGIVGNLSPGKGQLELINAFAEVLQSVTNAALLIVGAALFNRDDGYQQRLLTQTRALGIADRVRFLGQRNDVPEIMRSLDLLVLNSQSEAFPLVALEGLACGVPILSTTVGGVPELITHGENGWLIPAGNQNKLTQAIVSLIEQPDLRARLAKNGQQHVAQKFTVDKFITRLEALWIGVAVQPWQAKKRQLPVLHSKNISAALANREG